MRKQIILIAALFVAASVCAKAQTTSPPQYVGKKCPDCTEVLTKLTKWHYVRDDSTKTETIESPDINTWVVVDWANMTVRIPKAEFKITRYETTSEKPQVSVSYGDKTLVLYYNQFAQYIGHQVL